MSKRPSLSQKNTAAKRAKDAASAPLLHPLVHSGVPDLKITPAQFSKLEESGGISLSKEHQIALENLARAWLFDLQARRSPRPGVYKKRLDALAEALRRAQISADLRSETSSSNDYALLHWALNSEVQGAPSFCADLDALRHQIEVIQQTVRQLIASLPSDPGRARPYTDQRRIIQLADIFESAGGEAHAYASELGETGGMADTPFRTFAQLFYSFLPADDKRDPRGLDDPLRDALAARAKAFCASG